MSKLYTKIDGSYHPTTDNYCHMNNLHHYMRVWAVTQAMFPNVQFIVDSRNQEEPSLLFFSDNKELCDMIEKVFDFNFYVSCGVDPCETESSISGWSGDCESE